MRAKILVTFVALAFAGGFAMADSLTVNNAAAMGGSGTACSGGPCGLEVYHDNSDVAYVQDDSPDGESIYRATWLMDIASVNTAQNFRQTIFQTFSPNPQPGVGDCGTGAWTSAFRVFWYQTGGIGQNPSVQAFVRGNQCGERAVTRIPVNEGQDYRICTEWTAGGSGTGLIALAAVAPGDPCPSSGDPAWSSRTVSNQLTSIEWVRLGMPQNNGFAAGETGTLYFDEFESYRTLTP